MKPTTNMWDEVIGQLRSATLHPHTATMIQVVVITKVVPNTDTAPPKNSPTAGPDEGSPTYLNNSYYYGA